MTDTLDSRSVTFNKTLPAGSYRLSDLIRSEWIKLRSVRSTMWTLALTIVIGIGIGALATGETQAHWTPSKAIVCGSVSLVVAEAGVFVSYFLGQALLRAPATHTTLSSPGALRAVVGTGIYLCIMGLFALGIAVIIRHTAGAISTYIGILLILPIITAVLPFSIRRHVAKFLPDHIGAAIASIPDPASLAPWTGILVLGIYTAVLLAIGAVLLIRRDA